MKKIRNTFYDDLPLDDYVTCRDYALLWDLLKKGKRVVSRFLLGGIPHLSTFHVHIVARLPEKTMKVHLFLEDIRTKSKFVKECKKLQLEYLIPTRLK